MILKSLVLIMQLFISFSCFSHYVGKAACTAETLYISFFVEGKKKKIDNLFSITIVHGSDTIKTRTVGNRLEVPNLPNQLGYTVIFRYKKYTLSFKNISKKMLLPDHNFRWEFGIDNRPFNESFDLLPPEQFKADTTSRQLHYLRIDPMEEGVGLQFVNKIKY